MSPYCPEYAPFFGFLGAALALVFGNMGAAYGTWKSALGLATISKLPRHKVQTEMVMNMRVMIEIKMSMAMVMTMT